MGAPMPSPGDLRSPERERVRAWPGRVRRVVTLGWARGRSPARTAPVTPTPVPLPLAGGFVVTGEVDGRPAVARWSPSGGLICPAAVRDRAELVVALGETFGAGIDGREPVVAALDGDATAALLTVMRAFSRLTSLDVAVPVD